MVVASLLYAVCLYRAYGALDTLSPYIYYELLVITRLLYYELLVITRVLYYGLLVITSYLADIASRVLCDIRFIILYLAKCLLQREINSIIKDQALQIASIIIQQLATKYKRTLTGS